MAAQVDVVGIGGKDGFYRGRTAELVGAATTVAVGDRTWARFLVDLLPAVADSLQTPTGS